MTTSYTTKEEAEEQMATKAEAEEEQMASFVMPLQLQVLCAGVPDREILGSSTRIPSDPTPNMAELIAKAKLALASKPSRMMPPPPNAEKYVQFNSTLDQVDRQQQENHMDLDLTTLETIPDYELVNFTPILNVGLSMTMDLDERAAVMKRHREDTREEMKAGNKRIKLTALGS